MQSSNTTDANLNRADANRATLATPATPATPATSTRRALGASRASRARRANTALLLLLALIFTAATGATAAAKGTPDLPAAYADLNVGAGHKLAFRAYAEGVQIYRWDGNAWVFIAPEAVLYATDNHGGAGVVGIHYAGPTWESNSGSTVAAKLAVRLPAPDPATAIPWLKLAATASDGPGIFRGITFIQRLYTTGGTAPLEPGEFVGEEAHVPYTAEYFFYRKHK